jgi:hypothetical protein
MGNSSKLDIVRFVRGQIQLELIFLKDMEDTIIKRTSTFYSMPEVQPMKQIHG